MDDFWKSDGPLLVCLVIFLISRELVCWFWKINKVVSLLQGIDSKLAVIVASGEESAGSLKGFKQSVDEALGVGNSISREHANETSKQTVILGQVAPGQPKGVVD